MTGERIVRVLVNAIHARSGGGLTYAQEILLPVVAIYLGGGALWRLMKDQVS